jgi:hypothetical protein
MCIVCNPAFAQAFRKLTFPSRRQILKSAAATTAGAFICEATGSTPALAQAESFQDLADRFDQKRVPRVAIYRAKEEGNCHPRSEEAFGHSRRRPGRARPRSRLYR